MFATNHAVTGAVIGATVSLPYAIPAALLSHFIMDMLPHYGIDRETRDNDPTYRKIVYSDAAVALSLAGLGLYIGNWPMFIVGWVAYSPDLVWVYFFLRSGKSFHVRTSNWYVRFHHAIQKFERGWGFYVEVAYFLVIFPLFIGYLLT